MYIYILSCIYHISHIYIYLSPLHTYSGYIQIQKIPSSCTHPFHQSPGRATSRISQASMPEPSSQGSDSCFSREIWIDKGTIMCHLDLVAKPKNNTDVILTFFEWSPPTAFLSDAYSDILSGIFCDTHRYIYIYIHIHLYIYIYIFTLIYLFTYLFRRDIWHSIWHSIWRSVWLKYILTCQTCHLELYLTYYILTF